VSAGWEAVIGLEIHVQLATTSKIFSGSPTTFGADANSQASPIDLGLPGTLPVLNGQALAMAVRFGLAVAGEVSRRSVFARKNYFYPDLPKGYQISQYDQPVVTGGQLEIDLPNGDTKLVHLTRAHLEEDAGKSIHEGLRGHTGVDLNRAGVPLLEIVSEPEMSSAAEAAAFMRKIHTLVRTLGICNGNLAEGSLRCDANVSVRRRGDPELGTRAEVKNINSFRFVERAIDFEIHRQVHRLESGDPVVQETRLYDSDKNETRSMRGKEEAEDYRYFPDPDLLPVVIDDELISEIDGLMPELPDLRKRRFVEHLGISLADAVTLTAEPMLADFFEACHQAAGGEARKAANWVLVELMGALHRTGTPLADSPVSPQQLADLLRRMNDGTISGKIAKAVFEGMMDGQGDADAIIEAKGLKQITDSGAIEAVIDQTLADAPDQIEQYRAGSQKVFNYFVGQVMKATRGRANPGEVQRLLREKLDP
jgi:aspartyl-tRNA(Asn)/glutamyl-tRNA(Gln) amidotransferase subunit B